MRPHLVLLLLVLATGCASQIKTYAVDYRGRKGSAEVARDSSTTWYAFEDRYIAARREAAGIAEKPERGQNLKGIALSGGGIRSATFSLGVLQALARTNQLGRYDYVSGTSGGAYTTAWLLAHYTTDTRWLERQKGITIDGKRALGENGWEVRSASLDDLLLGDASADCGTRQCDDQVLALQSHSGFLKQGTMVEALAWLGEYAWRLPFSLLFDVALHTKSDWNWYHLIAVYSDRIGDTYLAGIRDVPLTAINRAGLDAPYGIFNANLLNDTWHDVVSEDGAGSNPFEFTAQTSGADSIGYIASEALDELPTGNVSRDRDGSVVSVKLRSRCSEPPAARGESRTDCDGPLRLRDAVAASGAAFDPDGVLARVDNYPVRQTASFVAAPLNFNLGLETWNYASDDFGGGRHSPRLRKDADHRASLQSVARCAVDQGHRWGALREHVGLLSSPSRSHRHSRCRCRRGRPDEVRGPKGPRRGRTEETPSRASGPRRVVRRADGAVLRGPSQPSRREAVRGDHVDQAVSLLLRRGVGGAVARRRQGVQSPQRRNGVSAYVDRSAVVHDRPVRGVPCARLRRNVAGDWRHAGGRLPRKRVVIRSLPTRMAGEALFALACVAILLGCGTGRPRPVAESAVAGRETIRGFDHPEDVEVIAERGVVVVSSMGDVKNPGFVSIVPLDRLGYPPQAGPQLIDSAELGRLSRGVTGHCTCEPPAQFRPHGISSWRDGNTILLAVLNHGEEEDRPDSAQLFELVDSGPDAVLRWQGCIEFPKNVYGNDLAFGPSGELFITNSRSYPRGLSMSLQLAKAWALGTPTGNVQVVQKDGCTWQPIANSEARFATGIAVSRDRRVFVSEGVGKDVMVLQLPEEGSSSARVLDRISVAGAPDNLSWDGERLLVAVHTDEYAFLGCSAHDAPRAACRSPWAILALDATSTRRQARCVVCGEGGDIGAVASASVAGDSVILGSAFGDAIAAQRLPRDRSVSRCPCDWNGVAPGMAPTPCPRPERPRD